MGAEKALKSAEMVFLALLTIGLMGLLFLMIYGNLSGNLGWEKATQTTTNETGWLNATGHIITGRATVGYVSFAITSMTNTTGGATIPVANYTLNQATGNITNATINVIDPNIRINFTYVVTYKGTSERNTDSVIGNLTTGATQFFSFSNVWFILTAITILIGIVLGVIALVRKTSTSGFTGSKGRSEFVS